MDTEQEQTVTENDSTPQNTRLIAVLERLELNIKQQNSFKLVFVRGMIYGLGTVIGATVLVALLGGLLGMFGFWDQATALKQLPDTRLKP